MLFNIHTVNVFYLPAVAASLASAQSLICWFSPSKGLHIKKSKKKKKKFVHKTVQKKFFSLLLQFAHGQQKPSLCKELVSRLCLGEALAAAVVTQ